ncbi:hypothetical protein NKDENANG_02410 [Candidatus Entotheonellaceae bacterium PAL068K]
MALSSYPPSLPARLPGAHLLAFRCDTLGFLHHVSQTGGDVASFRFGPERTAVLTPPDSICDVLVPLIACSSRAGGERSQNNFLATGYATVKVPSIVASGT